MRALIILVFLCNALSWGLVELEGAKFEDSVILERTKLSLNGVGLRTATLFKVKVYAAGLYLNEKTPDSVKALTLPLPKEMQMHFLRDIDQKDIQEAWEKSFRANCETSCGELEPALEKLKSFMTDITKGDRLTYRLQKAGVEVIKNGTVLGKVGGEVFSNFLLKTWIGKNPPSEGLRKGLLGKTD